MAAELVEQRAEQECQIDAPVAMERQQRYRAELKQAAAAEEAAVRERQWSEDEQQRVAAEIKAETKAETKAEME